jgi:hypothetical protein
VDLDPPTYGWNAGRTKPFVISSTRKRPVTSVGYANLALPTVIASTKPTVEQSPVRSIERSWLIVRGVNSSCGPPVGRTRQQDRRRFLR